ncbi:hemicentin-1-like [Homarus americanus]|uniref:hemicentin-1-like n=1 Tax=Homarus americanus TaxID=6706 RepID=UPI001C453A5B|nr:hemicentin-1-like [Homarus americanus]
MPSRGQSTASPGLGSSSAARSTTHEAGAAGVSPRSSRRVRATSVYVVQDDVGVDDESPLPGDVVVFFTPRQTFISYTQPPTQPQTQPQPLPETRVWSDSHILPQNQMQSRPPQLPQFSTRPANSPSKLTPPLPLQQLLFLPQLSNNPIKLTSRQQLQHLGTRYSSSEDNKATRDVITRSSPGHPRQVDRSRHTTHRRLNSATHKRAGGDLKRPSRDLGLNPYARQDSVPQLRYTPIEQTVSPGSPVSLKCSAVGTPAPVITWTRDHQPLLPSLRTSVGSFRAALGEVVSQVNLSSVTGREGGLYTCTASNTQGSVAHSARLNVYGPPFVRAMANVTAVSGEDVRLWCPAGGYPAPSIIWQRNGHTLPTSLRRVFELVSGECIAPLFYSAVYCMFPLL